MNKKFFTLLGTVALTSSVMAQGSSTPEYVENGKYYQLAMDYSYLISRGDSVALTNADDPYMTDETLASDSLLWKVTVTKQAVSGAYNYSFVNKATNKSLTIDGESVFAATAKQIQAVDNTDMTSVAENALYYFIENDKEKFWVGTKDWGNGILSVVNVKEEPTNSKFRAIKVGERFMTVADLNEKTTYSMDILSKIEGVEDGSYFFNEVGNTGNVFEIVSTSGNVLAVDSVNINENATIVGSSTDEQFGFYPAFKTAKYATPYNQFALLLDRSTDKVKVLVVNQTLSNKKDAAGKYTNYDPQPVAGIDTVAYIGSATYANETNIVTVATGERANGKVEEFDRPALGKSTAWEPGEGAYVLTQIGNGANKDVNGLIYACEFKNLKHRSNAPAFIKADASAYLPETFNYIEKVMNGGKVTYKVTNGYYLGGDLSTETSWLEVKDKDGNVLEDVFQVVKAGAVDTFKVTPITPDAHHGYITLTDKEEQDVKWAMQVVTTFGSSAYVINDKGILYGQELESSEDSYGFKLVADTVGVLSPNEVSSYAVYHAADKAGNSIYLTKENKLAVATAKQVADAKAGTVLKDAKQLQMIFKTLDADKVMVLYTTGFEKGKVPADAIQQFKGDGALKVDPTYEFISVTEMNNANEYPLFTPFNLVNWDAPVYLNLTNNSAGHYRFQSSENQTLALANNAGVSVLKALSEIEGAVEDDFRLWVDTACVENELKPLFYISTGVGANDEEARNFMAITGKPAAVNFVEAKTYGADSLIFVDADPAKNKIVKTPVNEAAWAFRLADNGFYIENAKTGQFLQQKNGLIILVSEKEDALVFESVAEQSTDNEEIATSEVTVIAGEGNVTIAGAAGKKVVVSNILGQVVANTVITSDNATIAAPAGVVVVAVEGEEAVKAIIK